MGGAGWTCLSPEQCMHAKSLSHFWLFAILWIVALQALVHGILRARILVWVAMPSSRGSSRPRDRTPISHLYLQWQAGSLPLAPPGKPRAVVWLVVESLVLSSALFFKAGLGWKPACRKDGWQTFLERPGKKPLGETEGGHRGQRPWGRSLQPRPRILPGPVSSQDPIQV